MSKVVGLLVLFMGAPSVVSAQPRGFVGAGLGRLGLSASSIDGPSPSTTYTNEFEVSNVAAFVGEAAVFVTRRLAIGAEVGLPLGRNTVTQEFDYLLGPPFRRISSYKEQTLFAIVCGRLNDSNHVTATWAVGGGAVRQNALERLAKAGPPTFEFGAFGDLKNTTEWKYGVTGGGEVSVKVRGNLSIVPQFRVLYVLRGNVTNKSANSFTSLGLDRLTSRIGATVRARF